MRCGTSFLFAAEQRVGDVADLRPLEKRGGHAQLPPKTQLLPQRVGVIKDWDSRWYARDEKVGDLIVEDYKIRQYLKKTLYSAGIPNIEIERDSAKVRIYIHCSRPGVVIGKKGEDIEVLKAELQKLMGVPVHVNIEEIRRPDLDAQLIADSITQQLEKRIMFRRAMKRAMQNAMRQGALGIKIMSSGRLNGAEIARTEWYREGRVPLHTLRADIDYGFSEAQTTYGIIGVKVWVYKGDNTGKDVAAEAPAEREDRRNRRPGKPANRRPRKQADGAEGKQARAPREPAPAAAAKEGE